jgi:hypothetical protein
MSTLYVDNLQPNLGSQVEIPDLKPPIGNVINSHRVVCNSNITLGTNETWTDLPLGTFSYTPKQPDSLLQIEVVTHIYGVAFGGWAGAAVRCLVDGTSVSSTPYSTHFGLATNNNSDMGYAIDLSEYTCTSASAVTIKAQAYTYQGLAYTIINTYGLGYIRVLEIAQ